jgi:hypothetical protein
VLFPETLKLLLVVNDLLEEQVFVLILTFEVDVQLLVLFDQVAVLNV